MSCAWPGWWLNLQAQPGATVVLLVPARPAGVDRPHRDAVAVGRPQRASVAVVAGSSRSAGSALKESTVCQPKTGLRSTRGDLPDRRVVLVDLLVEELAAARDERLEALDLVLQRHDVLVRAELGIALHDGEQRSDRIGRRLRDDGLIVDRRLGFVARPGPGDLVEHLLLEAPWRPARPRRAPAAGRGAA